MFEITPLDLTGIQRKQTDHISSHMHLVRYFGYGHCNPPNERCYCEVCQELVCPNSYRNPKWFPIKIGKLSQPFSLSETFMALTVEHLCKQVGLQ